MSDTTDDPLGAALRRCYAAFAGLDRAERLQAAVALGKVPIVDPEDLRAPLAAIYANAAIGVCNDAPGAWVALNRARENLYALDDIRESMEPQPEPPAIH